MSGVSSHDLIHYQGVLQRILLGLGWDDFEGDVRDAHVAQSLADPASRFKQGGRLHPCSPLQPHYGEPTVFLPARAQTQRLDTILPHSCRVLRGGAALGEACVKPGRNPCRRISSSARPATRDHSRWGAGRGAAGEICVSAAAHRCDPSR